MSQGLSGLGGGGGGRGRWGEERLFTISSISKSREEGGGGDWGLRKKMRETFFNKEYEERERQNERESC